MAANFTDIRLPGSVSVSGPTSSSGSDRARETTSPRCFGGDWRSVEFPFERDPFEVVIVLVINRLLVEPRGGCRFHDLCDDERLCGTSLTAQPPHERHVVGAKAENPQ